MTALAISGLCKSFGHQTVLRDVALAVPSGALVAILGASGSGKTTLLRLIAGFERADKGTIMADDRMLAGPSAHVPPEARRIGYVAQEGALFPHLSVADNITFGLPRRERRSRDRVKRLLDLVGLPAIYADRAPHILSGGEQQRVALARALAPGPGLVLLDEPFSALDAALRAETRDAVASALSAAGATALLVTHDQAEALSMGSAVAVLREGSLVQVASPQTLYRRPADAALARFVGEAVLLPGEARSGQVTCALGVLPLAAGMPSGAVEVLIRPEQIQLAHASPDDRAHGNAVVKGVTFYGHDARIELALASGEVVAARVSGHAIPSMGACVSLWVDGEVVVFARDADLVMPPPPMPLHVP